MTIAATSQIAGTMTVLFMASLLGSTVSGILDLSIVDPLLHEPLVALAITGQLRPAGQLSGGGEEQALAQVRRVVAILLEGGVGDLLIVRVVLEFAGGDERPVPILIQVRESQDMAFRASNATEIYFFFGRFPAFSKAAAGSGRIDDGNGRDSDLLGCLNGSRDLSRLANSVC